MFAKAISIVVSTLFGLNFVASENIETSYEEVPFDYVEFSQCLAEKKFVLYGVDDCRHCNEQKDLLADGFKEIQYVECKQDKKSCSENHITNVPTWVYPDGRSVGLQSLEELSELSGCKI